jgi:hypothetical protein
MKKIKFTFLTFFIIFLTGCPTGAEYPWLCDNHANHDIEIYASIPVYGLKDPAVVYPDTSISFDGGDTRIWRVNANTKKTIFEVPTQREEVFAKNDTLCIFIFHPDTMEYYNNSLTEISKNYSILCRYDVSLQDMKRLNWILTYPPDENMKDIKMYLPNEK